MPATDSYANMVMGATGSPPHSSLVTPDDDNDLEYVTRAITVVGTGTLKVQMQGDDEPIVYPDGAFAPGMQHAMRATRIYDENTTIPTIIAWW